MDSPNRIRRDSSNTIRKLILVNWRHSTAATMTCAKGETLQPFNTLTVWIYVAKRSNNVSKKLDLPRMLSLRLFRRQDLIPKDCNGTSLEVRAWRIKGFARCAQHLSCRHQNMQYNQYTYGLHPMQREHYHRRCSSDYARKCIHHECVRSRRKLPPAQMKKHWMTRHGGPTASYEVPKGCRDSHRK